MIDTLPMERATLNQELQFALEADIDNSLLPPFLQWHRRTTPSLGTTEIIDANDHTVTTVFMGVDMKAHEDLVALLLATPKMLVRIYGLSRFLCDPLRELSSEDRDKIFQALSHTLCEAMNRATDEQKRTYFQPEDWNAAVAEEDALHRKAA